MRDLLSPRRTGRADFPHPALLKTLVSGYRAVGVGGTVSPAVGSAGSKSRLPVAGTGAGCDDAFSGWPADSRDASRSCRTPCAGNQRRSSSPGLAVADSIARSGAGSRATLTAIRQFVIHHTRFVPVERHLWPLVDFRFDPARSRG